MKAKDYKTKLEQYESELGWSEAMLQIFKDFLSEADDIQNARGWRDGARKYDSIVNELSMKWAALARLEPRLDPDGFKNFIALLEAKQ